MRKLAVLAAFIGAFIFVPSALAATPATIFDGDLTCGEVTDAGSGDDAVPGSIGQVWCGTIRAGDEINSTLDTALPSIRSTVETFDSVPIDVNVAFPNESEHGTGPYPLVYIFHGYGGSKINFRSMQRWLDRGYAVFSQTNRGFHESCGTATSKAADADCVTKGFVRLDDTRYEVRDAQLFAGMLVDENLIQPTKIAATGSSYGGGMSMALAALKNRVMLENGTYQPWTSPDGTPMSLAVATPNIPWTDLAYSLVPNGSNIDYLEDASYYGPFGVMKQSYVNALYLGGLLAPGYYTLPGDEPEADLAGWKAFMDAGEPYEGQATAEQMLEEVTSHHSSYYIDHSQAPAPLLISSGFTDDLFPANEATRFYNRTRAQYPANPIGLFFGSFGHPRGQNGSEVTNALRTLENQWIDFYLADEGTQPASDVTTYTQVCPDAATDAGPFVTGNWVSQAPGEIARVFDGSSQTVAIDGGDRANGSLFSPDAANMLPDPAGKACAEGTGAQEPGTANYELDAAPAGGYTIMGGATAIANIEQQGNDSTLAFRLVDVTPDGTKKILVSRTSYRSPGDGFQVIQLNPNGWHVTEGHKLRLEVLPFDGGSIVAADGNFNNSSRPSSNQAPATIKSLELRIPVREQPGALAGLVTAPEKRVMPDRPGAELAPGNEAIGSESLEDYRKANYPVIGKIKVVGATVKGKLLTARISCAAANDSCAKAKVQFKGAPKKGKGKGVILATKSGVTAGAGKTVSVKFNLTSKARKLFKDSKKQKVTRKNGRKQVKTVKVKGLKQLRSQVLINGKGSGFVTVKRNGPVK